MGKRGSLTEEGAARRDASHPSHPTAVDAPRAARSTLRGEISDDALINAIHRNVVEIVCLAYAAILVYMSFVPFDFTRHPAPHTGPGVFWGLALWPFSLPDILANIALYVPLGALAFAVWRNRRLGRIVSGLLTVVILALISFLVEQGQHWVVSRVSTWEDVVANVTGAVLGASFVAMWERQFRRVLMRARESAQRNWWLTLAKGAVCIVVVANLRPYDVVVDVYHTAADLRHADVSPLAGWHGLREKTAWQVYEGRRYGMNELPRAQWEYGLDRLADVAVYGAVVALLAIGLAPQFAGRKKLYFWAGFVGMSLAAMIAVIRIFLISHGLDTAHFLCGILGWPVGCAVAHTVSSRGEADRSGEAGQRGVVRPSGTWRKAVFGLAVAGVVVYELVPFDFGTGKGGESPTNAQRICLLPFEAHFRSRPNDAFFDMTGELLRYSAIGVCLALALQRRRSVMPWRRQLWTVVAAVGLLSVALECLHLVMPTRQTDSTTVLFALCGGFAGAVAVRWVSDYRASLSVVVADDLLTGQLIEGEAYRGLPRVETSKSQEVKKSKHQQDDKAGREAEATEDVS